METMDADAGLGNATSGLRQSAVRWIALGVLLTTSRVVVAFSIPTLEMFDGDNPDAWIGPWVADTILGLTAPLLAYLAWRRIGPRIWAPCSPTADYPPAPGSAVRRRFDARPRLGWNVGHG